MCGKNRFRVKHSFVVVRCCFVSPFARAQLFAQSKLNPSEKDQALKEAASVEYPYGPETIIHIPGIVR